MFDYDDDERPTLRQRWCQQDLARHPDCRDPDHPGCPVCDPEDQDEEENEIPRPLQHHHPCRDYIRHSFCNWSDAMNWRAELQQQLDINNQVREMSLKRIGDDLTEYAPCVEGAGRAREIEQESSDE